MSGVELGARYRAGRDGARVVFRDGSVVHLAPFASIRFDHYPLQVVGRLLRAGRRGRGVEFEAPALVPEETKSIERGLADLEAGRFAEFDSVDALLADLHE